MKRKFREGDRVRLKAFMDGKRRVCEEIGTVLDDEDNGAITVRVDKKLDKRDDRLRDVSIDKNIELLKEKK